MIQIYFFDFTTSALLFPPTIFCFQILRSANTPVKGPLWHSALDMRPCFSVFDHQPENTLLLGTQFLIDPYSQPFQALFSKTRYFPHQTLLIPPATLFLHHFFPYFFLLFHRLFLFLFLFLLLLQQVDDLSSIPGICPQLRHLVTALLTPAHRTAAQSRT